MDNDAQVVEQATIAKQFEADFRKRMELTLARYLPKASEREQFMALAFAIRDRMISKWLKTQETYYQENPKRVYYLSLEFLMGRTMGNALLNLDVKDACAEAMHELGYNMEELEETEWDAGLGNGGLGRLAACFLDSMATLELPAYGYGIRYEYGMFAQHIKDFRQMESPDNWLRDMNPWEIARACDMHMIHFGGRVYTYTDKEGNLHNEWVDTEQVLGMAYDVPVPGYKTDTVNTLRLWSAKSTREFNLETFNSGDYVGAVQYKNQSENISKVLYPNDNNYKGKELRLKQQYFMVSASIQDILRRFRNCGDSMDQFAEKVTIQLNDTHPSIAIAELMRILLDNEYYSWDKAWDITTRTFAYTNHTVLPEALEKWPVDMMQNILPRHMQIIYEINHRFLDQVAAWFPGDMEMRQKLSIIEQSSPDQVRMSHLAIVGSFSVNGVAELHSHLIKTGVFNGFYRIWPEKFNNKTNGVTPRRWVAHANPEQTQLISSKIGDDWIKHLDKISDLEQYKDDTVFLKDWEAAKLKNKERLTELIKEHCDVVVDPHSMFDVQVKRIHEYKRQLLNLMHVITLYNRIRANPDGDFVPRTVIFGGKAAPGYARAKEIIQLINSTAHIINRDPLMKGRLKLVFIPNYGVSLAEKIIPGTDISEHISTAGMEASGTSNMKFALNGALTIGTLDGANVEMKEEVGDDNIFIFGHTEPELRKLREAGYDASKYYHQDAELRQVLDQIYNGYFTPYQPKLFQNIFHSLVHDGDYFYLLADYRMYVECQEKVSELFRTPMEWHKKALLNVARMSKFSSDRTIQEYADDIWNVKSCKVQVK